MGLYGLTIILSSKSCGPTEPETYIPSPKNPVEKGYIQLDDIFYDFCGKDFKDQTFPKITSTIYVKDPTTLLWVVWSYSGVTNPSSFKILSKISHGICHPQCQ
jgi:hypothetical protein